MRDKLIEIGKGMSGFVYDETNPESIQELNDFADEIMGLLDLEYVIGNIGKAPEQIAKQLIEELLEKGAVNSGETINDLLDEIDCRLDSRGGLDENNPG